MVDVATVQALDHEWTRESEVLAHRESLFVDVLRREVFCYAAVVGVAQLDLVVLVVEQVVDVHVVHVALDVLQIDIIVVLSLATRYSASILSVFLVIVIFFIFLRIVFVRLLQPSMRENLRDSQSALGFELDHSSHESLSVLCELAWEFKLSFQDKLVKIF